MTTSAVFRDSPPSAKNTYIRSGKRHVKDTRPPKVAGSSAWAAWPIIPKVGHEQTRTLLYSYVNQQQNVVTSQIAIQIFAHVLGFVQIFTLSTIASFSTRLRLRWSSLSLIELRLWQSISSNNVVWNLPFLQLGVLFSYILLHLLPSTLWAGAMSPMLSSKVIYGSIQLPAYPADPTRKFWNSSVASTDLRITRNEQGVFSYSPAPLLQGQIFIAASSTTSTNGSRIKPKNDLSRLSAGLENLVLGETEHGAPALSYSYQEHGYKTDVQCGRNDSSAWGISMLKAAPDGATGVPDTYLAAGVLPNSIYDPKFNLGWSFPGYIDGFHPEWYSTIGFGNQSIVALTTVSHPSRNMLAVATGNGTYDVLDKIHDIDPTSANYGAGFGVIPQTALTGITSFSMTNTDLYTSVLGNVFLSNIADIAMARDGGILGVMLDDILVGFSSAQLQIAGKNASAPNSTIGSATTVTMAAMRMGKLQYLIGVSVLNFLIVAVYLFECFRTRHWRGMPLFDHNDIASVVVAASKGGTALGDAVLGVHREKWEPWTGNSGRMRGGQTRIRLAFRNDIPVIEGEMGEVDIQELPLMSK
ncbi:hypothetical protein B0H14DRAFT_2602353 [Mycena olivaceomarginata]|nr:hypothetical protein B0H14DRAFT_2602353 [Mycena olivaceomarginata]